MQFLFLALINKLQMPAVIRSLKGNCNSFYRNPDRILAKCEKALDNVKTKKSCAERHS